MSDNKGSCITLSEYYLSDILLKDFREDRPTFKQVCIKLDTSNSWRYLHEQIVNKKYLLSKYEKYEKNNHGGGSSAFYFLQALNTKKDVTLQSFIATAKKMERRDIVTFLSEDIFISKLKSLKELSISQLESLSEKLDKTIFGIANSWKDFAADYGYTYEEITDFDEKKQIPNKYSPTEELLNDVINENDDFKLSQLSECLEKIKRRDVINILNLFEPKKQIDKENKNQKRRTRRKKNKAATKQQQQQHQQQKEQLQQQNNQQPHEQPQQQQHLHRQQQKQHQQQLQQQQLQLQQQQLQQQNNQQPHEQQQQQLQQQNNQQPQQQQLQQQNNQQPHEQPQQQQQHQQHQLQDEQQQQQQQHIFSGVQEDGEDESYLLSAPYKPAVLTFHPAPLIPCFHNEILNVD